MSKFAEFGNPAAAEWAQQTLEDCAAILAALCDREVDLAEHRGAKLHGDGLVNVRLDLVEEARKLIEVAAAGNARIMRQEWRKTQKPINPAAMLGSMTSPAKRRAARKNGLRGGRPKGRKRGKPKLNLWK